MDGVTIAALLSAHGRLTAEQSLGVLRGALLGLAHAHDRNLVHRDFAPANILADHAGTSKLVDFGLAAPIGGTGAEAMSKDQAARPPDARTFLARLEEAARQRYGADWLERASIAGLLAAVGTGAAVVTAGSTLGAAAASSDSAVTVFINAQATTGGVATATRRASRFSRNWLIGAGVLAAAAIAVPLAAVALNSNNTTKPAGHGLAGGTAGPGTAAASTSSTPATDLEWATGKYRISVIVTSTDIPGAKVGLEKSRVWTANLACTAGSCAGTVKSSSGTLYKITFDGTVLSATYTNTSTGPCVYTDGAQKGQPAPGTLASTTTVLRFQASVVTRSAGPTPAKGVPLNFAGTGAESVSAKVLKVPPGQTCTPAPLAHAKLTMKLVWIG